MNNLKPWRVGSILKPFPNPSIDTVHERPHQSFSFRAEALLRHCHTFSNAWLMAGRPHSWEELKPSTTGEATGSRLVAPLFVVRAAVFYLLRGLQSGENRLINLVQFRGTATTSSLPTNQSSIVPEKNVEKTAPRVFHLCRWAYFMGMLCQLINTGWAFINRSRLLIKAHWKWRKLIGFLKIKAADGAWLKKKSLQIIW